MSTYKQSIEMDEKYNAISKLRVSLTSSYQNEQNLEDVLINNTETACDVSNIFIHYLSEEQMKQLSLKTRTKILELKVDSGIMFKLLRLKIGSLNMHFFT